MATIVQIGPADHGRPLTAREFQGGDFEEGYQYELIDGRLYVSPLPNPPEGIVEDWVETKLKQYARRRPEVINWVYNKTRVYVSGRPGATMPEPDVAAYRDFPMHRRLRDIRWKDVSPLLVVEVLSRDDPAKDLMRNAGLYFLVPSIKEYWILDPRFDADRPSLRVHRRFGRRWRIAEYSFGETYTTRLLPGFELLIDPRR
jgi:Uma2 family endonuclease